MISKKPPAKPPSIFKTKSALSLSLSLSLGKQANSFSEQVSEFVDQTNARGKTLITNLLQKSRGLSKDLQTKTILLKDSVRFFAGQADNLAKQALHSAKNIPLRLTSTFSLLGEKAKQLVSFRRQPPLSEEPPLVSSFPPEEEEPFELLSPETPKPAEPKPEEKEETAKTITERIIERIQPVIQITQQVVSPDPSVDEASDKQLQSIESRIQDLFARNETQARQSTSIFQALSQSQRINNLSGITITNATVSGVSGLTDSDIPNSITASNYLLLTGGTLSGSLTGTSLTLSGDLTVSGSQNFSGLQTFSQASSTRLSVFDQIWIGGTSTTTLRGDGFASIIPFASTTAITVSGTASTSQLVVSSPSATSTFSGNIDVTGNINFNGLFLQDNAPFVGSQWTTSGSDIYYSTGNVGIGTSSPYAKFSVVGQTVAAYFTATTSLFSTFPYASTTALTVSGVASTTELIVSGTATSTFGGPLSSYAGNFIIGSAGTSNNLLFNPYGGKVGIGTSTPSYKLTVNSEGASENFFQVASSTQQGIFVITNDGRVGIGTTSPSQKLSVAGTIYASEGVRFPDSYTQVSAAYSPATKTSDYTLTANDNNKSFNNDGATALVTFTLPTASPGYKVSFQIVDSDGIRIAASGSDTIFIGGTTLAAPAFATSTVVGSEFILESYAVNKWTARLVGKQPKFRATMSGNQTVSAGPTKIQFNTIAAGDDNNNEYDETTNYRHTPVIPGTYIYSSGTAESQITSQVADLYFYKNNSNVKRVRNYAAAGLWTLTSGVLEIDMDGDDYVEMFIDLSGAGTNNGTVAYLDSWFEAVRVPD